MSVQTLQKEIKSREFKRFYLLWGEEDYLKSTLCAAIENAAVAKGTEGFNLHRFYGDSFDLRRFAEAVTNLPLMSDTKCVVLRDVGPESFGQAEWKDFTGLLGDIPEGCVVVLHFDALRPDKRSSRFKTLLALAKKAGTAEEISKPAPAQLEKWAYRRISGAGGQIAPACLGYLIDYCGGDMNTLACEIDKLTAFAAGREIIKEDVDGLAVRPLSASVYDLSKAVLAGNALRAYRILNSLLEQKEEPVVILATLSGAFCDLYRAKTALAGGAAEGDILRDFNYRGREFRVRNALRDSRPVSAASLARCISLLFETDLKLKSSATDRRVLLEELLASLAAVSRA